MDVNYFHKDHICPFTNKHTKFVWTDHDLPGVLNSCKHCTGEDRTLGQMLWELNEQRRLNDG
jgi:hypothetical protein